MPQHVTVQNYNPIWEKQFQTEKTLIKNILRDNVTEIYHIGSTAVKGLSAKPIIDIMPIVYDLSKVDAASDKFKDIGYEYLGEFGIKGRRYLRKGGDERTHQIHIFQIDDKWNIKRHLAVRDYLRAHSDQAMLYGQLKRDLADRFPYDIDGYWNGKESFVSKLEQVAVIWYDNTVRSAQIGDIEDIMQIWIDENIQAHSFIPPKYWKDNYRAVKNALPKAEIYVYTRQGKVIGFIGLNGSYIEGFFVHAIHQRQGIGRALLDAAKAVKPTLTLKVYKRNTNAVAFYLKNGFKITNESIDENTQEKEYAMQWENI